MQHCYPLWKNLLSHGLTHWLPWVCGALEVLSIHQGSSLGKSPWSP